MIPLITNFKTSVKIMIAVQHTPAAVFFFNLQIIYK